MATLYIWLGVAAVLTVLAAICKEWNVDTWQFWSGIVTIVAGLIATFLMAGGDPDTLWNILEAALELLVTAIDQESCWAKA